MSITVPVGTFLLGAIWFGNQEKKRSDCLKKYQFLYEGPFSEKSKNAADVIKCSPDPKNPKDPFKADLYIKGADTSSPCACNALKKEILDTVHFLERNLNTPTMQTDPHRDFLVRVFRKADLEMAKKPLEEDSIFTATLKKE